MTYLEKWLNESVFYPKKDEQPGAEYGFSRERLLELFTNCHEDLELELNRAQSELQHYKQLLKDQRDFASISDGAATEAIDELNEANAAIRWMDELFERTDTWKGWKGDEIHLPAIERALKGLDK